MAYDFANKTMLITGGTSGIGLATAHAFAQAGGNVIVVGRNALRGLRALAELRSYPSTTIYLRADVANATEVAALFREATTRFPRLDYAVNAAGILRNTGDLHELSYVDFREVVAINLTGVWLCMQAEITQMLAQGGGAIVNLTSGVVRHPIRQAAAYVATKHAIVGLTQVAALENSTRGLRVNCVAPGIIQTPILDSLAPARVQHMALGVPMRRMGTPDEVAQAILWLCSDHASYVNGITLDVGGGLQL